MNFRVGQEITPKERDPWWSARTGRVMSGTVEPKYGKIYVISGIYQSRYWVDASCLSLEGFPFHQRYDADDFRPVVRRTTSIELFERIRRDVSGRVDA